MHAKRTSSPKLIQDRVVRYIVFIMVATVAAFVLTLRWPLHYTLRLPNEYVLFRLLNSDDVYIEGHSPVPPKIVLIQVSGDIVFGVLKPIDDTDFSLGEPQYFMLNTSSGRLLMGLSESDFR